MRRINPNLRIAELEREKARLAEENEKLKADVDYIAMMTDIEIEEANDEPEV